jgi:LPS-assembly lipoprotein
VVAGVLSACGFQVRGATDVPASMERTYISATDRHSGFYQGLTRELRNSGVKLVDSPADATAIFTIKTDITSQRVLAVSARNVPREYEVYYTITYSLTSGEKTLIDSRTQTQMQAYTWDETKVLGKSLEEQELRNAIVDDLVRITMIQLTSL